MEVFGRDRLTTKGCARLRQLVWLAQLLVLSEPAQAQTLINVTNVGLRGDAVLTTCTTASNSTTVVLAGTNSLSTADAGKLILLFGVGPSTSGTNHQDLIAQLVSLINSTTAVISQPAGCDATSVRCIYGTQNANVLQQCINSASGTNTTIYFPAGNYLIVPPKSLDTHFVMQSESDGKPGVIIKQGGLHLLGDSPDTTVLIGNGAWQLKGSWVHRGFIFWCQGPVTNNYPLVLENLTLDGGVSRGNLANPGYPASTKDGGGWDETHGAFLDIAPGPLPSLQRFLNCRFIHWRGEMLKAVSGSRDTDFNEVRNCDFVDGDASGFNLNQTPHLISDCLFTNIGMAMEYWVGTMRKSSAFQNSTIASTGGNGIVLVGGIAGTPSPGYLIQSNTFLNIPKAAVMLGPAGNVHITGNQFLHNTFGLATDGAAYQGSDFNHDITLSLNTFSNTYYAVQIGGGYNDRVVGLTVQSNSFSAGSYTFANGYGWSSNVVFLANNAPQSFLGSASLMGQWFTDDSSNNFGTNSVTDTVGRTNIVSYATGTLQALWTQKTNAVFFLDDSQPTRIPPGARIHLTYTGQPAVPLLLGAPGASSPKSLTLTNTSFLQFYWTNGVWRLDSVSSLPTPPNNLRFTHS
jgi:hypothetical protein